MSGIESPVTAGSAAQAQRAFVVQPRVRRTLGTGRHPTVFVDQPQRGCVHRRSIAGGRNPVGIGPSVGIRFHPRTQGCSNPGLNSASPWGLADNYNTAFEEVAA